MKTSSAKSKGRKLQQNVRDVILEQYSEYLEPDDVRSTGMGQSGVDVQLSPLAKRTFPFSIECKNQQSISIWACLEQTFTNLMDNTFGLLVFKRNRSETYVCLKLDDFMEITDHTDFTKIFPKK